MRDTRARARTQVCVSPDRHAEDDDQVDVDEEGKVLPEQGLLHGATVSAGLAVAGGTRTRLSPR